MRSRHQTSSYRDRKQYIAEEVRQHLTRLGGKFASLSMGIQFLLLIAILLAKNGFGAIPQNIQDSYLPASQALPAPIAYWSASIGPIATARLLGIETLQGWLLMSVVSLAIGLYLIISLTKLSPLAPPSILITAVVTSSALAVVTANVGSYDIWTFVGGCLMVILKSPRMALGGTVLMSLGNPEQTLLASIGLFILARTEAFADWRKVSNYALSTSTFMLLLIQTWFLLNGIHDNRFTVIPYHLAQSLARFGSDPIGDIWSWLGIGWLIVLALLLNLRGSSRRALMISLVLIPAIATLLTADGARVFASCVLPSYIVAASTCWRNLGLGETQRKAVLAGFLILWAFVPSGQTGLGWLGQQIVGVTAHLQDDLERFRQDFGIQVKEILQM